MMHYVVVLEWSTDGDCGSNVIGVKHSLEDAKKLFNETAAEEREWAIDHGWIIYEDIDVSFDAGEHGMYSDNHSRLYIQGVN